jgi:hypothetical protein
MKAPLRHVFQYIVLCIILSALLALLINFNGSPQIQKIIIILGSSSYVTWGYIHHAKENTLDLSIVLEYVLYAALGSLLVIGLI